MGARSLSGYPTTFETLAEAEVYLRSLGFEHAKRGHWFECGPLGKDYRASVRRIGKIGGDQTSTLVIWQMRDDAAPLAFT